MRKHKILLYIILVISIILCVPSICYLFNYKTVDGFDAYYTYTLQYWQNKTIGLVSGIIVIGLFLCLCILYLQVIKNEKNIFQSKKEIFIFISIISFIFMMILPFLSSDIYYYIGDSWLEAEYEKNPYYTSVFELQIRGINDEILNNTGYWKATTTIYGPIWNMLAKTLVSFSGGSITIALFIFKIASYLIHILNCYIIYQITKSNKYTLLYGLNPLVLIELLSGVHNDIYLLLFILLALYFVIKKKNIFLTIFFIALSIGIKYSTILLVPFILVYCFRKHTIPKRILYCMLSGISIIALVVLFYIPYYKDVSIFTNMLIQGDKYNQSIMLFLLLKLDTNIFNAIKNSYIYVFAAIYAITILTIVVKKKISLKNIMKKYNNLMLLFIFVILTTFQKWYVLWIIPTIMWQSKYMRRFIIYLTMVSMIPSIGYFIAGTENYWDGILYSTSMFTIAGIILMIELLAKKPNNKSLNK